MNLKKRIPEPEQEMEGYKEVKSFFEAHKKRRKKWDIYDLVSRDILKNIPIKRGKVLDVGCGYGGLMNQLSLYKKDLNFVGIDFSQAMIKLGKKLYGNKKMNFLYMSADNLRFKDDTFDAVVCKDTFHHFKNPVKVLKEMFRVLKKRGYIYVTDLRRDASEEIVYQTIQIDSELNIENAILYADSIRASYTIPEMKKMLKRAGIINYKTFELKVGKNFLKDYKINKKYFLSASNYRKDKWVLIIRK